jgi:hypothetical protein
MSQHTAICLTLLYMCPHAPICVRFIRVFIGTQTFISCVLGIIGEDIRDIATLVEDISVFLILSVDIRLTTRKRRESR